MSKKIKKNFLLFLALILCIFVLSACDDSNINPDNPDTPEIPDVPEEPDIPEEPEEPIEKDPYPIGMNVDGYKIKYALNEEFDKTIEKVEIVYSDETLVEVTSDIIIDSTKFDKTKNGTYEIIISYSKDLNETTYTVKSFFLAIVGTGSSENSGGSGDSSEIKNFGAGTYTFEASVDLSEYDQNASIATDTKFADGFFALKGAGSKRANSSTYAIELPKSEGGWIEFNVNGSATIQIYCSSTGSNNTSVIALFDSESSLVKNNEDITTVTSTSETIISYTLTTGTYRILSQASTSYSTRGVRVYKIVVTQK